MTTREWIPTSNKKQNTGVRPRCLAPPSAAAIIRPLALSLDSFPNSESAQQDRADEQEYGADRQDIELQGKVHLVASLAVARL
jgi:hypothetical protein